MKIASVDLSLLAVGRLVGQPGLALPHQESWWRVETGDGQRIHLDVPATALAGRHAAAPSYLLALTWWLREGLDPGWVAEVHVRNDLRGQPTPEFRRAAYLLDLYTGWFDWFMVDMDPALAWRPPARPVLDTERGKRPKAPTPKDGTSEAELAHELVTRPEAFAPVNAWLSPRERLRDGKYGRLLRPRLPMGLFDGEVRAEAAWCPGHKSAVDLWGVSEDEKTAHLFELRAPFREPLDLLPEALYFATLAADVRDARVDFDPDGARGLRAVRRADRVVVWLVAPALHPMLLGRGGPLRGRTVLEAVDAALTGTRVQLRFLPYRLKALEAGAERFEWRTDEAWPRRS